MWLKESDRYLCKIENFAYGEINERNFSNPHPWYWIVDEPLPEVMIIQSFAYALSGLNMW